MSDTRAVLFWMTGIVTPSLPATLAALGVHVGVPALNRDLEALALGALSDDALLNRVGRLRDRTAWVAAFQPEAAVLATIDRLPESYQRWLIVDAPPAWSLFDRLGLAQTFSRDHVIALGEGGLARMDPDAVDECLRRTGWPAAQCLFIDPDLRRTLAGVRRRIPSAHYVNVRLLEREFYLRGFIGPVQLHPGPHVRR